MLYESIENQSTGIASAKRRAYHVGPISQPLRNQLEKLRVELCEAPESIAGYPHANKLQMFEARPGERILVALDTDILVVDDPTPWLSETVFLAKQADQNPVSEHLWRTMCEHFGFDVPLARSFNHFDGALTVPYFNSGVIVVPSLNVASLRIQWMRACREIWQIGDQLGLSSPQHRFHTDQIALTLALISLSMPFGFLPLEMNFPTHRDIDRRFSPDVVRPVLIHHHHRFDGHEFQKCQYEPANRGLAFADAILQATLDDHNKPIGAGQ